MKTRKSERKKKVNSEEEKKKRTKNYLSTFRVALFSIKNSVVLLFFDQISVQLNKKKEKKNKDEEINLSVCFPNLFVNFINFRSSDCRSDYVTRNKIK